MDIINSLTPLQWSWVAALLVLGLGVNQLVYRALVNEIDKKLSQVSPTPVETSSPAWVPADQYQTQEDLVSNFTVNKFVGSVFVGDLIENATVPALSATSMVKVYDSGDSGPILDYARLPDRLSRIS